MLLGLILSSEDAARLMLGEESKATQGFLICDGSMMEWKKGKGLWACACGPLKAASGSGRKEPWVLCSDAHVANTHVHD